MNAFDLNPFIQKISEAGKTEFTQAELAEVFGISGETASTMIQDYLRVLATDKGDRLSRVIYRAPGTRTSNTVWRLGEKGADVDRIVIQTADDLNKRMEILYGTIDQVGHRNPAAKRKIKAAKAKYTSALQALVETIAAATK